MVNIRVGRHDWRWEYVIIEIHWYHKSNVIINVPFLRHSHYILSPPSVSIARLHCASRCAPTVQDMVEPDPLVDNAIHDYSFDHYLMLFDDVVVVGLLIVGVRRRRSEASLMASAMIIFTSQTSSDQILSEPLLSDQMSSDNQISDQIPKTSDQISDYLIGIWSDITR